MGKATVDGIDPAAAGARGVVKDRRKVVKALLGMPILMGGLMKSFAALGQSPRAARTAVIDAHCHLFNVTDLAASQFIYVVFLHHYFSETERQPTTTRLQKLVRRMVRLLSWGVPTAAQEAASLAGGRQPPAVREVAQEAETEVGTIQEEIQSELAVSRPELAPASASWCAARSAGLRTNFETAVGWIRNLRTSRARLADRLARAHHQAGFEPRLLCPALVDYSAWLDERLVSPLPDQVRVMRSLSLRPDGPAVHAYVAFDPLRDAMYRRRIPGPDGNWDPLALVRSAIEEHGCIGVKLYPPMGFRPAGNEHSGQAYPRRIAEMFGGNRTLGREIDLSLGRFWAECARLEVPVITHAAYSNHGGAGAAGAERSGYGGRGDPFFWAPVFTSNPRQRILLGHFGGFTTSSAEQPFAGDCPVGEMPFERTWEAVFGRHVLANPASPVFADISYFSEVFDGPHRARIAGAMRRYVATFDPEARHIVFGSDWVMTGIEKFFDRSPGYTRGVVDFLSECGITGDRLDRVLHHNAARFLGLGAEDANRRRLAAFLQRHGRSPDRLPTAIG